MSDSGRRSIDLNADVGEGWDDAPLFAYLSSVNVACGGHAGDDSSMEGTAAGAVAAGLAIGAHPSFPDREGFGRRITTRAPKVIAEVVADQVERLARIVRRLGASLSHVKPHGALYNLSASDPGVAAAIAGAVRDLDPNLRLVGLAGSHSLREARRVGLEGLAEAFADRGYCDDGSLAPRDRPDALIHDPEVAARRATAIALGRPVLSVEGHDLRIEAGTLCVHGDTPGALAIARRVYERLRENGVAVRAPDRQPR